MVVTSTVVSVTRERPSDSSRLPPLSLPYSIDRAGLVPILMMIRDDQNYELVRLRNLAEQGLLYDPVYLLQA